ncbi:hypothetical protein ASG39_04475 [Rhizobium sp. Leaf371]|nr:hypothetical protein ASG39_04475 [Rhizobium sp. Leaf371]
MFLPWIAAQFEMNDRTARKMMEVAEVFGTKWNHGSDLNASATYELAAPSKPQAVRDAVEELLVYGQKVTVADIRRYERRKLLRIKLKDGRDAGHALIREGLARVWPDNWGNRWCDR